MASRVPAPGAAGLPIEARLRASGLPTLPRLSWMEVDLGVLRSNAQALAAHLGPDVDLAVVVKADGYGHGLLAAAHAGLEGGATVLAVATLDEALVLRAAGFTARILVLYAVPPDALGEAVAADLDLVAMDARSVADLCAILPRWLSSGLPVPKVHLGLDTGMTRGGLAPAEGVAAARQLLDAGLPGLAGTWSHLASPEARGATERQVAGFTAGLAALRAAGIDPGVRHLNATGGMLDDRSPHWDMARAGLAFYGHLPGDVTTGAGREGLRDALAPAVRITARAASIETVPAGTTVGYGGTWVAERESVIATLAVGYADGWTRLYAPASRARVRGTAVPLVGRVGSDAVALDVTDVTPAFGFEDEVVLVAPDGSGGSTVEDLASRRGSISWEVLDDFTTRLARVYTDGGRPVAVRYLDGRLVTSPGYELRLHAATD